ncbi:uncharacterized protein RMCC_0008 [Mycolicibacterium canariasense]|uniref:Uncharacterized protein n=1 Tax=Mycolicibacterium canariasense TaxID=228230 RepID=A0A100W7D2_MYCCR|nr:hypothetical protein [Mycolicibacterium canariasense]MCV7211074.1 hypothetical protein [Mycolicibacterium canariasense]ORV01079.1 hypothetical protein AWB94_26540 [Mycolicibacterium canariasense]GAS93041.1 uncharacterized protein RMCC_0008 [Mycolicibacterium canariasense]
MNLAELATELSAIGIPKEVVAVGGRADYAWCIERASDGHWEVFWYERGNKNDLVTFTNESDAGHQLLARLAPNP